MGKPARLFVALVALCSLMLGLAACGREEPPPPTQPPAPSPSPTPAPAPTVVTPPPLTATPIEVGGTARPILHTDVEKSGVVTLVVTKAFYADGREPQTVVRATGATWSPGGTQVAFVSPSGQEMNVANLEGEQETFITSSGQWRPFYAWPSWSPDGGKVALIEVGWCMDGNRISDVLVVDIASRLATDRYGPHDFWFADATEDGPGVFSMPEALRWSPDGSRFLISWDKAVVLNFETGKIETISEKRVIAEWASDSKGVYYFDTERRGEGRSVTGFSFKRLGGETTELADEQRLQELGMVGVPGIIPALVALSPSGSAMAMAVGQSPESTMVRIYGKPLSDALDPAAPSQTFEAEGRILAMDWSPESDAISVLSASDSDTKLLVLDLATGEWTTAGTPVVDTRVIDDIPIVLSWGR